MAKAFEYKDWKLCEQCMKEWLWKKNVRDEKELEWLLDGADQYTGKMSKWPVRDADGDYVKVDLQRLRLTLNDETPLVVYDLGAGAQLYYEVWRVQSNDPVFEINEDIERLDEDDYKEDGLDCEECGERIWGPPQLLCSMEGCENVLTEGATNIAALKEEYSVAEQLCAKHYCDLMRHIDDAVKAELSKLNSENPSKDYDNALNRIAERHLHLIFRHLLSLLTVADEVEQSPRSRIVETIKREARMSAYDKPFEIFRFDIEKKPAYFE